MGPPVKNRWSVPRPCVRETIGITDTHALTNNTLCSNRAFGKSYPFSLRQKSRQSRNAGINRRTILVRIISRRNRSRVRTKCRNVRKRITSVGYPPKNSSTINPTTDFRVRVPPLPSLVGLRGLQELWALLPRRTTSQTFGFGQPDVQI